MKTKFMFIVAASMALVFASCGGNASSEKAAETEVVATALEVDDLLANADSLAGQQVELQGICTHICSHGATKIFLMGSDDTKTIRIEAAELGAFDQKCVNSIVNVKGILKEERIDEAYLQRWEAQAASEGEQHGDGEEGCSTEKAARGEKGNSVAERIADFRAKIAARKEATGKEYLSFYFVEALEYAVVE